jgi:GH24 family phage-related lysozyme (muramidase)
MRDLLALPPRTPGPLGVNDAADPARVSLLGGTPGPLGTHDRASPDRLPLPSLQTFHAWLDEASVHLPPSMQVAHYYPAGSEREVLAEASRFIARWEGLETHPYVPGASSGVTIGVGYDLAFTSEAELRSDWAELASMGVGVQRSLGVPALADPASAGLLGVETNLTGAAAELPRMFPFRSALFTPLDRLAFAAGGKLSHAQALQYVMELQDIAIPHDLSMRVFENVSLPRYFARLKRAMAGVTELPTGVQVALLSLAYNRGTGTRGQRVADDILDSRWEMSELRRAVLLKDVVWIYWHFESMRRLWASKAEATSAGLIKRRNAELALIYPYVASDLQHQSHLQRYPRFRLMR